MNIVKLSISYDRGLAHNDARDLGTDKQSGTELETGEIIRGLGTKFRSRTSMEQVKQHDKIANNIRQSFRNQFLVTPIDGVYVVPAKGVAQAFLRTLVDIPPTVKVRVTEFTLESSGGMDGAELAEWAERIKRQLSTVSLGRSKEADEEGLKALETLSRCPVIKESTGARIRELVEGLRTSKLDRVELKRKIETLNVEVDDSQLAPRRAPELVGAEN
jgi:hypothetical protein